MTRNSFTFESEIQKFDSLQAELKKRGMIAEEVAARAFILKGPHPQWLDASKDIGLAQFSLIHGNEVAGLAVTNRILEQILKGHLRFEFPVAFALGNVPAGQKNVRFVESDLNRAFASASVNSAEERRALELIPILKRSQFFLDLHQTIEATQSPFFIGGFDNASYLWARELNKTLPVISYSIDERKGNGLVATSYAIAQGGIAITAELGQKGFEVGQIDLGENLVKKALEVLNNLKSTSNLSSIFHAPLKENDPILSFSHRIANEGDSSNLLSGLANFSTVKKGQKLGTNSLGDITSPIDGKTLFPKYGASKQGSKELCIILEEMEIRAFKKKFSL